MEGRGRRARARSRRAPSRPPCWLVCGCQTELDTAVVAAAAAAAAAPQAPVAPASPALPAAAAAHPGRLRGAEVSRGPRASGGGRGAPGRGPSPAQGADALSARLPSSQPPRACTPAAPAESPPQVDPFLSNQTPPHGLEDGPLPIWIPLSAARTPPLLPYRGVFLLHPRSQGLLLLPLQIQEPPPGPHPLPFSLEQPRPTSPEHFPPLLGPGAPFLPSRARSPSHPHAQPSPCFLQESGEGSSLSRIPSCPLLSFGLERGPFPSPGTRFSLPTPTPTAQRGRGRQSLAPAAFCSAWDGRDPARRSRSANPGG